VRCFRCLDSASLKSLSLCILVGTSKLGLILCLCGVDCCNIFRVLMVDFEEMEGVLVSLLCDFKCKKRRGGLRLRLLTFQEGLDDLKSWLLLTEVFSAVSDDEPCIFVCVGLYCVTCPGLNLDWVLFLKDVVWRGYFESLESLESHVLRFNWKVHLGLLILWLGFHF